MPGPMCGEQFATSTLRGSRVEPLGYPGKPGARTTPSRANWNCWAGATMPDPEGGALPQRPVHGGIKPAELRALGLDPEQVLDFSASISPIGPPPGVWEAMRRVDLPTYPDPQCHELKQALADHFSPPGSDLPHGAGSPTFSPENFLVGNGSTEIIHLLARAFLPPAGPTANRGAVILSPTYGEYAGACEIQGAPVTYVEAGPPPTFQWDLDQTSRTIESVQPALVFLCNPNNPTGAYLTFSEVESLAWAADRAGAMLVLDEAYSDFVDQPWNNPENTQRLLALGNVVILRSMTKSHALTSLRIGYSVAPPEVTARLAHYQPDWSVNGLAQAAAAAALQDPDYLDRARTEVSLAKNYLIDKLTTLEFNVPPSAANFLLVEVTDAAAWRDRLAQSGLFVRDCSSFGLPNFIRIGIRNQPDCQRLIQAISRLLQD